MKLGRHTRMLESQKERPGEAGGEGRAEGGQSEGPKPGNMDGKELCFVGIAAVSHQFKCRNSGQKK